MTTRNYLTSNDDMTTSVSPSYNLSCRTYFPENYDERKTKLPIVFFLHGVGERGENLELVETHGIPKLIKNGKKFSFHYCSSSNVHLISGGRGLRWSSH